MQSIKLYTIDAFTSESFKGNSAAICVLESPLSDEVYQIVAMEMNLSETAFLVPEGKGYRLRWFTPTTEVDLCGHATLAAAKVIYDLVGYNRPELHFFTKSGLLKVSKNDEKFVMDFPLSYSKVVEKDPLISEFAGVATSEEREGGHWRITELPSEKDVFDISPNFSVLLSGEPRVFVYTAKSTNSAYDFVSRVFCPAFGIDEDPVTGSAHCYLASYWSEKLGKKKLVGKQVSKRTGIVECLIIDYDRVLLSGECMVMAEVNMNLG